MNDGFLVTNEAEDCRKGRVARINPDEEAISTQMAVSTTKVDHLSIKFTDGH